jgi:L-idonate 5-dehydrogenase
MKAFLIFGKLDGSLKEVPENTLAADEVKIRVSYVGICGSDLHYYFDGANGAFVVEEPLIPGHELSGVIVEDPSGEFKPGTNITLHPATYGVSEKGIEDKPYLWPKGAYLGSASTHPHTQGAMAAALAEPLGVAIHAINVADGVSGKKILVSGSGPIGLCVVAAAKILGATSITATDILSSALKRAEALGATESLQIGKDQLPENAFDVVFECSAAPVALSSAFNSVRRAGVVVQVGMLGAGPQPIAIAPLISKEIQLRGTFRFNDEINDAVTMLAENEWIKSIITHVIPLSDAVSAFNIAKDSEKSGKVLVKIN